MFNFINLVRLRVACQPSRLFLQEKKQGESVAPAAPQQFEINRAAAACAFDTMRLWQFLAQPFATTHGP
jgi:hypothetical protein